MTAVHVGVTIPNFGPEVRPWWLKAWAARAEETGYHMVMVADHVPTTPDVHAKYVAPYYEPFTTLAWLAGSTSRIEIGASAIVLPHRHPVLVARMAANVDRFSGGRLVLGAVIGWSEQEYRALGLPFAERAAMMDDYLSALAAIWDHDGDFVTYHGKYVSFTDVATDPRPIRRPPLWIGANHAAAVRRTVRHGSAWHPAVYDLDWLENKGIPLLRAEAESQGRPVPQVAGKLKVFLTENRAPDEGRRPGEGTIQQISDDLRRLVDMGVDHVLLDTDDPRVRYGPRGIDDHWRVLSLLAEDVIDLANHRLR